MRFSRPSPAMIVALIALVFAATGTGIAATGVITGTEIKDGSITSADLATGAVTSSDIKNGTVNSTDIKNGSLSSADLTKQAVTQFDQTAELKKVAEAKLVPGPTGGTGAAGLPGAPAFSTNWVNAEVAAGNIGSERFYSDSGAGAATFAAAATTTPSVPTTINNVNVDLVEPPTPDVPTLVLVQLITSLGTPQASALTCGFDPHTATGCKAPGSAAVPAGARLAWRVQVLAAAPPPAPFSKFKVSLAYTSTTVG